MPDLILSNTNNLADDGAPAAGDNLYFRDGNTAITTNLNQSGLAAGGFAIVSLVPAWKANVGSVSDPFRAEISSGSNAYFDYFGGGGQCWYYANGNSNLCDKLFTRGTGAMHLITGGTITVLESSGCITNVASAVVVPTIRLKQTGVVNVLGTAGTAPTTVEIRGGNYYTQRGASTATLFAGTATCEADTNGITSLLVNGGTWKHVHSGTIGTLTWRGGTFDVSELGAPLTISTLVYWDDVPGLDLLLNHPNVTISASTRVGSP